MTLTFDLEIISVIWKPLLWSKHISNQCARYDHLQAKIKIAVWKVAISPTAELQSGGTSSCWSHRAISATNSCWQHSGFDYFLTYTAPHCTQPFNHPSIVISWLKYCWKGYKIPRHPSITWFSWEEKSLYPWLVPWTALDMCSVHFLQLRSICYKSKLNILQCLAWSYDIYLEPA